jgi:hypothetical protein
MQDFVGTDQSLPALHQVLFHMHIQTIKILYQQCTSLVTGKKQQNFELSTQVQL